MLSRPNVSRAGRVWQYSATSENKVINRQEIYCQKGNSGAMPSWTTQRRKVRQRDGNQCQICGDTPASPYCQLQVHHIRTRAEGGADELDNLATLCDLCHAVCHWHMGPAWCGLSKSPPELHDGVMETLTCIRREFQDFLRLPPGERRKIRDELWTAWGIARHI